MNDQSIGNLFDRNETILWEDTPDYTVWLTRQDDKIYIRTDYKNVDALLSRNNEEAANFSRNDKHGDIVKVASIPSGLYFDWQRQGITKDPDAMKRRLNDSDYAKFRVNNWRL